MIKTVLALCHGVLPRTLHAEEASSRVDWSSGAVRLLTEARPWDDLGRPRRAGVSSFGMSGTNAHAVLEQAPDAVPGPAGDRPVEDGPGEDCPGAGTARLPWLLSAKSPAALRRQAARLLERLESDPGLTAAELGHALANSRAVFPQRAALVGADRAELRDALTALATGRPSAGLFRGRATGAGTVFVFPGQGSQWPGMANALLAEGGPFATAIKECEQALAPHVDWALSEVLRSGEPADRVDVVQPALFAVMVALAEQWRGVGVAPDAVVGHSQGEIAAACVAGALSLPDAAMVVALRSRALRRLEGGGGMVSLSVTEARTGELLLPYGDRLCVAAVNGPEAVVVAGEPEPLSALLADCARAGVRARPIPVDYAAHSGQVAEVRAELLAALAGVRPKRSEVPLFSTLTGERIDGELLTADYWYRNLREPVAFASTTLALLNAGHELFVEVSPHPVLLAAVDGSAQAAGRPVTAVGTLRRADGGPDRLLRSLAEAWTAGAPVAWPTGRATRPVQLPTYAFEPERYWLPTPGRGGWAAPGPLALPAAGEAEPPAAELAARLAPLDEGERRRVLLELVAGHAAAALGHTGPAAVRTDRAFAELGFDSMLAVRFRNELCAATGLSLPPTAVFDQPTPAALAALLYQELCPVPRDPAQAELDRLEQLLAAMDPTAPGAGAVGSRLHSMLRAWGERVSAGDGPPEGQSGSLANCVALDTATADELFDLLDSDFGMA